MYFVLIQNFVKIQQQTLLTVRPMSFMKLVNSRHPKLWVCKMPLFLSPKEWSFKKSNLFRYLSGGTVEYRACTWTYLSKIDFVRMWLSNTNVRETKFPQHGEYTLFNNNSHLVGKIIFKFWFKTRFVKGLKYFVGPNPMKRTQPFDYPTVTRMDLCFHKRIFEPQTQQWSF